MELPVAISSLLYLFLLLGPGSSEKYTLTWNMILAVLILLFNIVLSFSIKRIQDPYLGNQIFLTLFYIVFLALFIISGVESNYFYLILYLQLFVSSYYLRYAIPILVSIFYFQFVMTLSIYVAPKDIINFSIESLFLLSAAWAIISRYKLSGIDAETWSKSMKHKNEIETLLEITKSVTSTLDVDEVLYRMAVSLGIFSNLKRSSIISIDSKMKYGTIEASFEGKHLRKLKLDLKKFVCGLRSSKAVMIKKLEVKK